MGVSADSPYTDIAYKLVEYDGRPLLKLSSGKKTLVARKQIFRQEEGGLFAGDTIALREEKLSGEALLETVMRDGRRVGPVEELAALRTRCTAELAKLPAGVRAISEPNTYPVYTSERLDGLQQDVEDNLIATNIA